MDAKSERPPFDCSELVQDSSGCSTEPVKTSVLVTVHPRPAIQNYVNTMIPSYSVTLHDVADAHFGVYRCSARRRIHDNKGEAEIVYRIISFE